MKNTSAILSGIVLFAVFFSFSCKKSALTPINQSPDATKESATQEDMVITPFGARPASQVHQIESGYALTYQGNHLVKVQSQTGKVAEDFGDQLQIQKNAEQSKKITSLSTSAVPGLGSGWITNAQNDVAVSGLTLFTTDWIVPSNPPANNGQLLYLFNGLQDGFTSTSHILQPVLQYGNNSRFGGNYWVINNWYASCQTCPAFYGTPVTVTPGTGLEGAMNGTANTNGTYNYTSKFWEIDNPTAPGPHRIHEYPANNSITVNNVPEMHYIYETMEAYNMQQSSNYPNGLCAMTNINARTGSGRSGAPINLNFIPYNVVTDVGQHTIVVSSQEVDLYFH
ncbi:hypothetical protein SAMN05421821_12910 [Mucilaginibacter lappiensis]|uniref:Uncharacterized protein n=1 Tax=Mucilaginibacter lappiensis TaxID=354630 RepID=A0ABR6PTH7_9SPHI|nr:hypothetical protein [Mucilaginibacter lappiensis]MBB6113088.1 hypothetical protein [Mucilaginibacter lappiensis]SIS12063.1 hypothetical protein SAMN05421821_12910 [Mucilaginibacter lappiensis]